MHKRAVFLYGLAKGEKKQELLMKAVTKTHDWHEGHKRDDGSEYFEHPLRVCNTLLTLNNPKIVTEEVAVASLLHDAIEDKRVSAEELKAEFGEIVFAYVDAVTKRDGESNEEYSNRVSKRPQTILIKGADRLHNMATMVHLAEMAGSTERLKRYIEDTGKFVLQMLKDGRRIYLDYSDAYTLIGEMLDYMVRMARSYIRAAEKNQA